MPSEGRSIKLGFTDIQVHFQNSHIWPWNLAVSKSSRGCAYNLFLIHVVQIKFNFHSMGSSSKIQAHVQNCHIWAWNLATGKSFRSCTYTLFLPHRVKIDLIFALWAAVSEIGAISEIAIFGHKTWQVAKVPKVAHILSFCPRMLKLSIFLL